MEVESESVKLRLTNELIKAACILSMKGHSDRHSDRYYLTSKQNGGATPSLSSSSSMEVSIIAFKGSKDVNDFYQDDHFGHTKVDCNLFPSLQRIGEGKLAIVNSYVLQIFQDLLNNSAFKSEVEKAVIEDKKLLFAGHSSGGGIASLAMLWVLDEYTRKRKIRLPIGCVTFGSPLIGDETLTHAVRREKWADHFTHFVMEHDIVPRMMLAPKASIQQNVNPLMLAQKASTKRKFNPIIDPDQTVDGYQAMTYFENVLINASTVASHDASVLMETTNSLKEKLLVDFVNVSPYRPFGIYVFCTQGADLDPLARKQQLVVENPNAVLQLLFYFLQLPNEDQDLTQFALQSLTENFVYKEELNKNGMRLEEMVHLRQLNEHLLTSNGTTGDAISKHNKALFELAARAKLCLLAAEEAEKRKKQNEDRIRESMKNYRSYQTKNKPKTIEDMIIEILKYKHKHNYGKVDYYEAFKLQNKPDDYLANVNRLEQAKVWDSIIEMVMRKDLPDEFEVWVELVDLATQFRRVYEPLDIANYYRLSKGDGYLGARPKRYEFTQRWYEHANATGFKLVSESNFVATVEDLIQELESESSFLAEVEGRNKEDIKPKKTLEEVKKEFEIIQYQVSKWQSEEKMEHEDVYWGDSVLSKLHEKLA